MIIAGCVCCLTVGSVCVVVEDVVDVEGMLIVDVVFGVRLV